MRVRRPTERVTVVAITLVALIGPCVWAVVSRRLHAVGDIALIELRTRDVLSAHPPLVGAYSRYGWSHPGPLEFYLFAIPNRLLGRDFAALRLTSLLFNSAALIAVGWVARRRGAAALAALLAGLTGLVWGLDPNALADSWNVTIAVVPFLLTIVACWCAWCGDRWAWLVASVAFSFVFQAHIGFGVVLAPLVLVTMVRLLVKDRHDPGAPTTTFREVSIGVAAGLLLALPALADVLAHWPGNLGRLLRWSFAHHEPTVGLSQGIRLIGRATSLSFPLHARFPNQFVFVIGSIDLGWLPGSVLALLTIALVLSARRDMAAEVWLCTALVITWIAAVVAASRVTQPLAFWLVEWLQPLAWLTWVAVALVGWRLLRPIVASRLGTHQLRQATAATAVAVLAVGTVAYARGSLDADEHDTTTRPIEAFVAAAQHVDRSQPVHIEYGGDPFSAGTVFLAVANELDRSGFTLCVDTEFANQFGSARVCRGRGDLSLFIRDEPTALEPPQGATVLAISDPLVAADRARADALTARLTEVLLRNDLSEDEPLLHSPLVSLILDHLPPDEAAASRQDVARLAELRSVPGTRLGLYLIIP
jgi:hypothetical protein